MALNCNTPAGVLKLAKDDDINFIDLRFTDPRGKWQHLAISTPHLNEDSFADGVMFDGSSIAGGEDISESDMALIPDPKTAVMDPFSAQPSLVIVCDVHEPSTGEEYSRDPRSAGRRAEAYLKYSGIGDTAYFGPEAEFFIFDDVRYSVTPQKVAFQIDAVDVGEALEQHRLAFHHRLGRQRAQIAQAKDRGTVADHRHQVALGGETIGQFRFPGDFTHGLRHAGAVSQAEVAAGLGRFGHLNADLPRTRFGVIFQGRLF